MKNLSHFLILLILIVLPLRLDAMMEGREEKKAEEASGGVDRTERNSREAANQAAKKQAAAPSEEKSAFGDESPGNIQEEHLFPEVLEGKIAEAEKAYERALTSLQKITTEPLSLADKNKIKRIAQRTLNRWEEEQNCYLPWFNFIEERFLSDRALTEEESEAYTQVSSLLRLCNATVTKNQELLGLLEEVNPQVRREASMQDLEQRRAVEINGAREENPIIRAHSVFPAGTQQHPGHYEPLVADLIGAGIGTGNGLAGMAAGAVLRPVLHHVIGSLAFPNQDEEEQEAPIEDLAVAEEIIADLQRENLRQYNEGVEIRKLLNEDPTQITRREIVAEADATRRREAQKIMDIQHDIRDQQEWLQQERNRTVTEAEKLSKAQEASRVATALWHAATASSEDIWTKIEEAAKEAITCWGEVAEANKPTLMAFFKRNREKTLATAQIEIARWTFRNNEATGIIHDIQRLKTLQETAAEYQRLVYEAVAAGTTDENKANRIAASNFSHAAKALERAIAVRVAAKEEVTRSSDELVEMYARQDIQGSMFGRVRGPDFSGVVEAYEGDRNREAKADERNKVAALYEQSAVAYAQDAQNVESIVGYRLSCAGEVLEQAAPVTGMNFPMLSSLDRWYKKESLKKAAWGYQKAAKLQASNPETAELYHKTAQAYEKLVTVIYNKGIAAGIKMFSRCRDQDNAKVVNKYYYEAIEASYKRAQAYEGGAAALAKGDQVTAELHEKCAQALEKVAEAYEKAAQEQAEENFQVAELHYKSAQAYTKEAAAAIALKVEAGAKQLESVPK